MLSRVRFSLGLALIAAAPLSQAQRLRLSVGDVDPRQLSRGVADDAADAAASHLLVQFEAGQSAAVRAALLALGVRIEAYVPDHAFRVRRDGVSLPALKAIPAVRWVGRWRDAWKMAAATRAASGPADVVVYGHVDGDSEELAAEIGKRLPQARLLSRSRDARLARLVVRLPEPRWLDALAALDAVTWIAPYVRPELHNTEAAGVIQSGVVGMHPLWSRGLTGRGQIVARKVFGNAVSVLAGDSLLGRRCLEGRDEFGWVPGGSLAVYSTALVPLTPGAPRWTVFVTEFDQQGAVRSKAEAVSTVVVRGFVSSRSFLSWPARDPRGPFVPIGIQVGTLFGDGGIEFTDDADVSQVVPIPEEFVDGAGTPVVRGLLLDGGEALAVVSDGGVVRSAFGPLARDWGLARHRAALSNGLLCRIGRTALDGGGIGYSLVCE